MAIGYLISPVIQVEDINGKPLVGGRIRVYRHGTTIPYITYKDFNGDMNPAEVILDNKGMCVLLADVDGLYDVYCEDRNHVEQWSRLNVGAGQSGGGSSAGIDSIVSSDNSLVIIRTGSSVDITINRDGEASALEAYSGVISSNGNFQFTANPINSVGDDIYLDNGQILCKKKWYHYDATVVLTWNGTPVNLEQDVIITGPDISDRVRFDLSVPHVETVDISGVCEIPQDDSPITFAIQSLPSGMTAQITNASIHAIEMGAGGGHTYQPGTGIVIEGDTISVDQSTVAMQSDLPDMSGYQEKLTTGDGISIDQNNEISVKTDGTTITVNADGELVATGGSFTQIQADYAQTNDQAVDYIKNKPDLSVFAQSADLAPVATSGDYDDLTNKPTIPAAQVNSDWNASSGVAQILNKPSLATVATTGDYNDLTNTPVIPPGVVVDQVYDATSTNAQSGTAVAGAISGKQDTISDLSDIRSGAALGETAVQPGDLATVATTGNYSDLNGTPTLATVATTGDYNDLTNTPTIPAAQVNSDWNAASGVAQILNKPSLSTVATSGDYNDLTNKPSIPAAQVNSDWNASSGVSQILNKPTLAAVATSGAYSDLTGTPTINNVPAVTSADDDKVLKASYSGGVGSYAWENDTSDVPAYTTSDDGKVLGVVDSSGTASLQWVTPSAGTVTDVEVNGSSVVSGGVASITIPAQVQSDWLESDSADPAYIVNKPSIPVVPPTKDLVAGTGINIVQGVNDVTISATDGVPSVTSSDGGKVLTAAYSGGTGSFAWESLPATREVPTVTSSDDAKVLTATYSGGTGSFAWASLPAAPTLSSLNTAGITDIQVVQALPASPISTVLYLIEET